MNKKELATVAFLILMIFVWLQIDARFIKPLFPDPPAPVATATPALPEAVPTGSPALVAASESPEAPLPSVEVPNLAVEAQTLVLSNALVSLRVSNMGAGVEEAVLSAFPESLTDPSPVRMDFVGSPALVYDVPGLNRAAAFQMEAIDERSVRFTRELPGGLRFTRVLSLAADSYVVTVTDAWQNPGATELPLASLPIWVGQMLPRPEVSQKFGPFLGIDARHSGRGVKHYVKAITKGVGKTDGLWEETIGQPLDWFGVKNKFFTQVLTVGKSDWPGAEALLMRARKGEGDARIGMVQAATRLGASVIPPERTLERSYTYYVGPISMDNLRALGLEQEEIIDFRLWPFFVPVGKLLMRGLTGLYSVTGNWGVAILLLTFIVRMLFWPLTQKGTDNMKRMSQYGPQMKELREKYKNNPQKLNVEMAAFYKEHKINPMAGCLPMFVQIPVFIALYGTLRVAVELRFAEFLWIRDLSEQEALFFVAGFPVNILPLTMGATMIWQQRLTPGTMDEQQRKIMMMMPVVFLFISYNMPAGLLLYWTASNLISIYQSWHTKKREAKRLAANPAPAPVAAPSALTKKSPSKGGKKR